MAEKKQTQKKTIRSKRVAKKMKGGEKAKPKNTKSKTSKGAGVLGGKPKQKKGGNVLGGKRKPSVYNEFIKLVMKNPTFKELFPVGDQATNATRLSVAAKMWDDFKKSQLSLDEFMSNFSSNFEYQNLLLDMAAVKEDRIEKKLDQGSGIIGGNVLGGYNDPDWDGYCPHVDCERVRHDTRGHLPNLEEYEISSNRPNNIMSGGRHYDGLVNYKAGGSTYMRGGFVPRVRPISDGPIMSGGSF